MNEIKQKTKKIRKTGIDKKAIWDKFKSEERGIVPPIECVYRASGQRERCDCGKNMLATADEGFLTCPSCGVIYKDTLDQSA